MPAALARRGVAHPRPAELVPAVAAAGMSAGRAAGHTGRDHPGTGGSSPAGTPPPATGGRRGRPPALGALRRSVLCETAVAAGILAATAVLVNAAPARTAAVTSRESAPPTAVRPQHVHARLAMRTWTYTAAFSAGGPGGSGTLRAITARSGSGARALYLSVRDRRGRLLPVLGITATFTQPATGLRPIRSALVRAGPGNFIAPLVLAGGATWRLSVTIRTAAKHTATVTVITTIP